MRGLELVHPTSLDEAIKLLDTDDPTIRPFSGGTALMLMMKTGVFQPTRLVNLCGIEAEHAEVTGSADSGLKLGALATLASVERSPDVIQIAPVIARTMKRLANVRVRNVARIGGNLAHGDPHMDLPPVLSSLGGEVVVRGPAGERRMPIEGLFSGYYQTVLEQGELITQVVLPPQRGWSSAYLKCTTRSADDWPALGVAVSLRIVEGAVAESRIMVSAATEKLTRLASAEAVLKGTDATDDAFANAAEAAAAEAETIEDARGSAEYKTELLRVHVRRALGEAVRNGVIQ
ncbi:FAD binding domain-containing protein [Ancylobacter polymorphus]|uniref:FAD binding domain-containing protein n=1 Tax=Ancylobacter polymorphus TaxID=223390 RepID=A0A9E7A9Q0_9HYPH|nr:FAD binding domain-containing protein [Ancylobacter polymorphus]UOK73369.1 FAD binding domain-containing protein [Ancylobacter polymorphus]